MGLALEFQLSDASNIDEAFVESKRISYSRLGSCGTSIQRRKPTTTLSRKISDFQEGKYSGAKVIAMSLSLSI